MVSQRILLVRHGETDYNVMRRWQGHLDIELNANGKQQAQKIAQRLATESIQQIYSSDLKRCSETAHAIAEYHTLTPHLDKRLREINVGIFEGQSRQQMKAKYSAEYERWDTEFAYAPPNGESREQTQARAYKAWQEITAQHPTGTLILVSHGGTLRLLLTKLFPTYADTFRFGNTSLSILTRDTNNKWAIETLNDTQHLETP
ncbi:MAG: histidine phosphatase family protein [Chloroflexota bacterium]